MAGESDSTLSLIGVFIIMFAAQRVAYISSEYITIHGLNGRFDLLILFIAIFFTIKVVTEYLENYINRNNSKMKRETLNEMSLKLRIQAFIFVKYRIVLSRILKDLLQFSVLYLSTLTTLYVETYIRLFLSMWDVSTATSAMMIIAGIIILVSIKAEFFGDIKDLRPEQKDDD